jgi:vancomycin permeability regulator SanA
MTRLGALAAIGTAGLVGVSIVTVRAAAAGRCFREHRVPPAPVGLVLGAQVYPNGMPSRFLRARLDLGHRLLAAGRVDRLLLSGDAQAPEYDEPAAMRDYLLAAGIPGHLLTLDPYGLDTYDSCVRARDVYSADRVVIVTQTYHLPRAVGTARLVGLDAVGVGDSTVRRREDGDGLNEPWVRGWFRDQLACVKTVWDVATRRRPTGITH